MIAIAQFVAISCYLGAAALAAVPFARPVRAPVAGVVAVLALGIVSHGAAFATAAAAGTMYLLQHRELKSRRFKTLFRFFPPLATLDRVNHIAAIAGWLGLTLGVVLAGTYSLAYHELNLPQLVWGSGAWLAATCLAFGRMSRGWQAQRAARYSSAAFVAVLVLYVAFRVASPASGQFL